MTEIGIEAKQREYRDASRILDYFVTATAVVFLLSSLSSGASVSGPIGRFVGALAIVLFALSIVAGLRKLQYFVAVLATSFSIAQTESRQHGLTAGESSAVVRDLNDTLDRLTRRTATFHLVRNWLLVAGIIFMVGAKLMDQFQLG